MLASSQAPAGGADHARHQQAQEQALVDVAQLDVGETRDAGGEDLGDVHRRAGHRRAGAGGQQKAGAGDAIGHAERAVHRLRQQADQQRTPELRAVQRRDDELHAGVAVGLVEEPRGQRDGQAHQQEHHRPHGHAQHRVAGRVRQLVLHRRQAQFGMLGVDGVVAEVEVADLHGGRDSRVGP
jgi:hypothetical protein